MRKLFSLLGFMLFFTVAVTAAPVDFNDSSPPGQELVINIDFDHDHQTISFDLYKAEATYSKEILITTLADIDKEVSATASGKQNFLISVLSNNDSPLDNTNRFERRARDIVS